MLLQRTKRIVAPVAQQRGQQIHLGRHGNSIRGAALRGELPADREESSQNARAIISHAMKSFFRLVLLALVLLVVALVSALTAMRFAIHGREVAVPDLVGKTPAEARRIADAGGFQMDIERQYYSPTVPEGKILSQLPARG